MAGLYSKKLIIFDLDDTLIDTSDLYWNTRKEFLKLIQNNIRKSHSDSIKISTSSLEKEFEQYDERNIKLFGYNPKRYTFTMRQMYDDFVREELLSKSADIEAKIHTIGAQIYQKTPKLIEGAKQALTQLKKQKIYTLILVTRGDKKIQDKKIEAHNLADYFEYYQVVQQKSTKLYRQIIEKFGANLYDTWIIGDSVKSEINPAIEIGCHAILFKYQHHTYRWIQEHSDSPINDNFFSVSKLSEIPFVINSTVMETLF